LIHFFNIILESQNESQFNVNKHQRMSLFTFVDICSGIGGFHMAAAKHGGQCLLACEIDPDARVVYKANYGIDPLPDVTKLRAIPECDLLCSGFPCVAFSNIGRRQGTKDPRGRIFYSILKLVKHTPPKVLLFENVMGLLQDNQGKTFRRFQKRLEKIGYHVSWATLDAANFGVPQHRERVFIIGVRKDVGGQFMFNELLKHKERTMFKKIMSKWRDAKGLVTHRFDDHIMDQPIKTRNDVILRVRLNNYINNKVFSSHGIVGTLCAGFTPFVYDERHKQVRRMTIPEMMACQGLPVDFNMLDMSRTTIARFIGNAVCIRVIDQIVHNMILQGCLGVSR
jgi:DNA (cytosine-5)-methyltransferase 1